MRLSNIHFDGPTNFRDLGGHVGQDGRAVRRKRLFRSNHLDRLSERDSDHLQNLGLRRAFDLRGVEESGMGCMLPGIAVIPLSIEPPLPVTEHLSRATAAGEALTPRLVFGYMESIYRDFILSHTPQFRALFAHLIEDDRPSVIHCTAGKDRTGIASALFLASLGVSYKSIKEDYLLTNQFWKPELPPEIVNFPEDIRSVMGIARETYLAAALTAIDDEYGSLETYLQDGLGIGATEHNRLRLMYLDR